MNGRKRFAAVAAVLAVGTVGVAIGWAASGDTNQINACADKQGNLRMLSGSDACTAKEAAVHWSVTGPQGAQGPQGAPGAQGPAGPQGPPGAAAGETQTVIGQVSFKGVKQGQIKGGDGTSQLMDVTHFTADLKSPRDIASGQASGKRQYQPIIIRKLTDAASPLLLQACATNETLSEVIFTLYGAGGTTPKTTVKLTNASCAELAHDDTQETISLTFQKITWTYIDGGITAEDDWLAPAA
jgi:type VI secretion system secreted protein Hcp